MFIFYFAYILIRVMCLVVLPLVQGEDKLAAGDQAQRSGSECKDVKPIEDRGWQFF